MRRALLAAVIAVFAAAPIHAQDKTITIFAAASMKNAVDDINTAFAKVTGIKAVASYAASSALAKQIEAASVLPWLHGFFGLEAGTSYVAIPGLFCGPGNYGVSVRLADNRRLCVAAPGYLQRAGTPIGAYDTMIAGQALRRGLTVITADADDFGRVDDLM